MVQISADFLQDEGARGVIAALGAAGEETRFVGGCVRDAVLGIAAGDIDLATTALPEKVLEVLPVVGFTVRPLGHNSFRAHGVIFAWRDGHKYEIATLREDVQTDGRHAIVAFTRDWELDARRRDFTINALSADADGQVHDYCGGLEDLRARRVRFIGHAATRVREDYLRILRFYRFHVRFGTDWDTAARAACRDGRAGLAQLSRERVTEELCKLLSLENPLPACAAMTQDKIFADIIPQLNDTTALEKLIAREKIYGQQSWLLRLAAWGSLPHLVIARSEVTKQSSDANGLLRSARNDTDEFLDQFIFTRTGRADIKNFATLDFRQLNHALYHHGVSAVRAAVLLRARDAELPQWMTEIEKFTPREFPLQAEDILQMGVAPGPRLGEILRETENWWLAGGCAADRTECLKQLEKIVSQ